MAWSARYLEESLFYEPWKTKFIEVFVYEKLALEKKYRTLNKGNKEAYISFINHFISVYKLVLQMLKKKLLSQDNKEILFNSDIINESFKSNLITDTSLYYEILRFITLYHFDTENYLKFKDEYLNVFIDFNKTMKAFIAKEGFREKDYVIYDNTQSLWGIDPVTYQKIIRLFLTFEDIKIVRICGSRVTNSYREFSDIDLISEGTYTLETFQFILKKIYDLEIPYIIDLNDIYKHSKPFIYRNIVRSNIFYKRSDYINDDYEPLFKCN